MLQPTVADVAEASRQAAIAEAIDYAMRLHDQTLHDAVITSRTGYLIETSVLGPDGRWIRNVSEKIALDVAPVGNLPITCVVSTVKRFSY
jgi:hypothetical protein